MGNDPNPVIFMEPKYCELRRSAVMQVFTCTLGKLQQSNLKDMTVVGMASLYVLKATNYLKRPRSTLF
jgi:pyruvate/2-oxoglutarate/acetoin dehydrogenase E1 component